MVRPSNRKVNMLTGSIPHCLDSLVNPLPLEIPYSLTPLLSVVSKNSMNYAIIQCNLFNVRGLEGPNFLQGFESRIFSPYYFLLYLMVCSHHRQIHTARHREKWVVQNCVEVFIPHREQHKFSLGSVLIFWHMCLSRSYKFFWLFHHNEEMKSVDLLLVVYYIFLNYT